ncbi:MAG: sugar-transfer associated ATP-grasp domain-containing protein [Oscillospiraceae bacterium]|nr:sugar-transfer associated ATP-grasp domain-containing protein [Oscillospiraceae bacterium]
MDLAYIRRVLGGASFKKAAAAIDAIHKKTGKSKAGIALDMASCLARYGAGYKDYEIFEFYAMDAQQRATYMTRLKNRNMVVSLNDQSYSYIFDQKNIFDEYFRDFLGREVLDLAKTDFAVFERFFAENEFFFAKPNSGESGKGIEKLKTTDFADAQAAWTYVNDPLKHFGVLEQPIVQHEAASRIYPCAVNCFRIVTLVWKGVPYIIYAVFKMGDGGRFIDNLDNGGVCCHFDLDKGEISGPGHTQRLVCYDAHPYTHIPFVGYKLPYMDEIKALVKKAALVVPQIKYVGWDVCLTPTGPILIEGNDFSGYDFPQLPDADKPRVGYIGLIKSVIPDFDLL